MLWNSRHVLVAWTDGCGPAPPAAGPVLAPLQFTPKDPLTRGLSAEGPLRSRTGRCTAVSGAMSAVARRMANPYGLG